MSNTITWEEKALENDVVVVTASVLGAGAAAPTVPTTHKHVVASVTRSGVGVFVIQLKDKAKFPTLLGPVGKPCVVGADGRQGDITAIDPDAGTIAIACRDATGAADDLEATDQLYVTVRYRNSKVRFGEALG